MNIKELQVRDVMQPIVKTITKEAKIERAAEMMYELGVSSLVVEPENDRDAFGIITRKDVVEAFIIDRQQGFLYLVKDMMSKPAITVGSNLSIENCIQMMRLVGVRRLPVVDGTRLVGIVSNSDIFLKLIKDI